MCSVTVGGSEEGYLDRGVYAEVEKMFFLFVAGFLAFTGFEGRILYRLRA